MSFDDNDSDCLEGVLLRTTMKRKNKNLESQIKVLRSDAAINNEVDNTKQDTITNELKTKDIIQDELLSSVSSQSLINTNKSTVGHSSLVRTGRDENRS